ncbi:MAG: hypothetical protein K8S16_06705, partial [Bacteroidales bacterium]|nr:hypothetical protein [Bacteroidales bacterium]
MKTNLILVFIFILAFPCLTDAQNPWSRITPTPQENSFNDICKIPGTNKIIAVGDGATVMISDDEGETWQLILNPGGLANDFPLNTVYFYDASIGFIGGHYWAFMNIQDYILKTTDGGLTWALNADLPGEESLYIYDFYFVNQNTGFAVAYNTLLKTTDGGENWFEVETGATFNLLSIDFCNDSTGFIVGSSYEKVLKTTDYGNTWTEVIFNSPLTSGSLEKIQFVSNTTGFVVQDFGDILKTTNAGAGWGIVFSDEDINAYAIDFFDENHGVAGCYQDYIQSCIISTNDGGNTWTIFTLPVFQNLNYSVCAINSTNFLFCGIQGMMFQSVNGGDTWNPVSERKFWGDILQVQHLENNTVFCLAFYDLYQLDKNISLYKSSDGGASFTSIADFL